MLAHEVAQVLCQRALFLLSPGGLRFTCVCTQWLSSAQLIGGILDVDLILMIDCKSLSRGLKY